MQYVTYQLFPQGNERHRTCYVSVLLWTIDEMKFVDILADVTMESHLLRSSERSTSVSNDRL